MDCIWIAYTFLAFFPQMYFSYSFFFQYFYEICFSIFMKITKSFSNLTHIIRYDIFLIEKVDATNAMYIHRRTPSWRFVPPSY